MRVFLRCLGGYIPSLASASGLQLPCFSTIAFFCHGFVLVKTGVFPPLLIGATLPFENSISFVSGLLAANLRTVVPLIDRTLPSLSPPPLPKGGEDGGPSPSHPQTRARRSRDPPRSSGRRKTGRAAAGGGRPTGVGFDLVYVECMLNVHVVGNNWPLSPPPRFASPRAVYSSGAA